jgi:hypothetical protein
MLPAEPVAKQRDLSESGTQSPAMFMTRATPTEQHLRLKATNHQEGQHVRER